MVPSNDLSFATLASVPLIKIASSSSRASLEEWVERSKRPPRCRPREKLNFQPMKYALSLGRAPTERPPTVFFFGCCVLMKGTTIIASNGPAIFFGFILGNSVVG